MAVDWRHASTLASLLLSLLLLFSAAAAAVALVGAVSVALSSPRQPRPRRSPARWHRPLAQTLRRTGSGNPTFLCTPLALKPDHKDQLCSERNRALSRHSNCDKCASQRDRFALVRRESQAAPLGEWASTLGHVSAGPASGAGAVGAGGCGEQCGRSNWPDEGH